MIMEYGYSNKLIDLAVHIAQFKIIQIYFKIQKLALEFFFTFLEVHFLCIFCKQTKLKMKFS